jgi:hypothetical protein
MPASMRYGTLEESRRFGSEKHLKRSKRTMRGVLLWLIGIPIPIIILLYLFHVI